MGGEDLFECAKSPAAVRDRGLLFGGERAEDQSCLGMSRLGEPEERIVAEPALALRFPEDLSFDATFHLVRDLAAPGRARARAQTKRAPRSPSGTSARASRSLALLPASSPCVPA